MYLFIDRQGIIEYLIIIFSHIHRIYEERIIFTGISCDIKIGNEKKKLLETFQVQ